MSAVFRMGAEVDGGAEADGHAGASRKFYIFSTDAESLNYTSLVVQYACG